MARVLAVGGVRFVLAGVLVAALAACFVGRADAASVFSPPFANSAASAPSVVVGDRALTLKWGAVKGAAGYRVSWRGRVLKGGKPTAAWSAKWLGLKVLTASARSYKATGLVNGAQYQLRLESNTKAKKSAWVVKSTLVGSPKAPVPAATVPGAPTGVSGVAGDTSVVVSWLAPSSDGGSAITDYTATAFGAGGSQACTTTGALSCTVAGLTNGTPYTFRVKATNARGNSVASVASAAVTLATWPGAPTGVSGAVGDGSVVVSWLAPSSDGGSAITGYTVTADGDGSSQTCTTATLSCSVTGLTNGTPYTFTVKATNARGNNYSLASGPVTPATVPGAPTSVSGAVGDASVVVSWLAPSSDGGSAVTGYTVTASGDGGSQTCTTATLSCSVTGLTNGTSYTFTVKATNARGNNYSLASGPVTPATVPGAPTSVSGVAGDGQVVVSWLAPSSDGGSAVTGYTVTASGDGGSQTCATATLSCTVTGLTNGTPYTFTAVATNARGNSASSAPSATVTPSAPPSCANGGAVCVVGDTGPGGGKVFYAPGGTFTETGAACGSSCRYLEAAPVDWNSDASPDPNRYWGLYNSAEGTCSNKTIPGAAGTVIGSGFANTAAIMESCPDPSGDNSAPAALAASTYAPTVNGAVVNGWFLPSIDELNALVVSSVGGLASGSFPSNQYWSSSQFDALTAWAHTSAGFRYQDRFKFSSQRVRPVRAF